jgi:hypothetical protein
VSPLVFWDLTLAEIYAEIKASSEKMRSEMQWQALLVYKQADLIGTSVSRLFKRGTEMPKIYDAFPSLFEKETTEPIQQHWQITKERTEAYATHRRKQKRGETK